MSVSDKIIKELDKLEDKERQEVLRKLIKRYMPTDAMVLGKNYSWWDNEEDDVYNEK